ncbi:hypothetical protein PTKIN_Ptkin14bG0192700 [Pterospermum kingtungense]
MPDPITISAVSVGVATNAFGNLVADGVKKTLGYFPHVFGDRVGQSDPLPDLEFSKNNELVASESYTFAFDKIMVALKDDKVNTIGVWGLGGVGKTTLVTQVGYTAKSLRLFHKVIKVVVSKTPDFGKIQDKIANSFDLKLEKTTPEEKAGELWSQLEKVEKVLLMLDDMWSELNLKDIGVPFAETRKGCKIILTTRRWQVCEFMKSQVTVSLGVLKKDEAWNLFKMNASLENASPDIIKKATEVAEECGGLPIAIVTLARALRGKGINGWELARLKLERSRTYIKEFPKEVENNVYRCLEASYTHLDSAETKKCFLLCGLYPEDYTINVKDLVIYAWGLRFYKNAESIEEVRLEVFEAIDNLKGCGLLLEGHNEMCFWKDEERYVKVHDVVREVARWIASREDNGYLTKSRVESENQKLKIRLLHNYDSKKSSECFEGLQRLQVLSIRSAYSWNHIYFSLNALKSLTNLRALKLEGFKELEGISSLAKLTKLEILRILCAEFHESIEELGELENLRLLDLHHCHFELGFSPNLIRRLVKLEELSLDVPCLDFPEDFVFPRLERYNIVINTDKRRAISSRSLSISGGLPFKVISNLLWNVELLGVTDVQNIECLIDTTTAGEVPVATILQNLREVRIEDSENLQVIFQHDKADNQKQLLSRLKMLYLWSLPMLEFIWKLPAQHISLQSLEAVKIYGCGKLKSLFSFSLARSLVRLEKLDIDGCGELKQMVEESEGNDKSPGRLPKLRYLKIKNCDCLEYVFPNFIGLPLLEKIVLIDLLQLKQICNPARQREEHGIWPPQLQHLERNPIRDEDHGPTQYVGLPDLKVVKIERCNKLKSLFTSSLIPSLRLLKELSLSGCKELVTDKTKSNTLCLPSLETLKIIECPSLKYVMPLSSAPGLPHLKMLELFHLPNLSNFGPENYVIEAPDLKHLKVTDQQDIPLLSSSFGGPYAKLDGRIWQQHIWKCPLQALLTNLTELEVYDCKRLTHVFLVTFVRNLQQLNKLKIRRCEKLEQIVNNDDMSASSSQGYGKKKNKGMLVFPQLKKLCLESLPCLTRFSPMDYHLVFPSLKKLVIEDCFQMITSFTMDSTLTVCAKTKKNLIPDVDLGGSTSLNLKNCKDLGWSADTREDHVQTSGTFTSLERLVIKDLRILDIVSLYSVAQNLKQLIVKDCDKLEEVFEIDELLNSKHEDQAPLLSLLECLELVSLCELRWILKGPTQYVSLSNLNVVKIEKCNKLETLFPSSLIPSLSLLKTLSISRCKKLETVFMELESTDETESNTLCLPTLETLKIIECPTLKYVLPLSSAPGLPRLKVLELRRLPKLSGFGPENYVIKAPNLKHLEVTDNTNQKVKPPRSILQDGSYVKFDGRIWKQQICKGPLQVVVTNLTEMEVYDCKRLTHVFPVTLVRNLQQLNKLKIRWCEKLEQIIIVDDDDMSASSSQGYGKKHNKGLLTFPQLKELCLESLSCLTRFSHVGYHLVFPSLERLTIEDCFQMITRFTVDSTLSVHAKTKAPRLVEKEPIKEIDHTLGEYIAWHRQLYPITLPPYVEESEEISAAE